MSSGGHAVIVTILPAIAGNEDGSPGTAYGPGVNLTLRRNDGDSWSYITQVTVVNGLDEPPSIEIQLDLPFDRGHDLMETNLLNLGNKVEVQILGLDPDTISPKFEGFVQEPPDVDDGTESVTVTIKAGGLGVVGVKNTSLKKSYESMSPRQVIDLHAVDLGFDEVRYRVSGPTNTKLDRVYGKDDQFYVNTSTSIWEFLRTVCKDVGCHLIHSLDTGSSSTRQILEVVDRSALIDAPSQRTFVKRGGRTYFSGIDVFALGGDRIHPLRGSFKVEGGGISWAPGSAKPPEFAAFDMLKKTSSSDKTRPIAPEVPRLGERAMDVETSAGRRGRESRSTLKRQSVAYVPNSDKGRDRAESDIARRQFDGSAGIKAGWQADGIPDLLIGEIVLVVGVGARYECEKGYMVTQMTHSVSTDDYATQVSAVSNGFPKFLEQGALAPVVSASTPAESTSPKTKTQTP